METEITIRLSSGKKIEFTQEEYDELKRGLGETMGVPYPVYPVVYPQPYIQRLWEPGIIWCGGGEGSGVPPQ